jgi:MFS transporter, DHA2 family, multidrug resistance protein
VTFLSGAYNQQAQIIAYNNDYKLLILTTLPALLLLLLMRRPRVSAPVQAEAME